MRVPPTHVWGVASAGARSLGQRRREWLWAPRPEFEFRLGYFTEFLRASVPSPVNGALTVSSEVLCSPLSPALGLSEERKDRRHPRAPWGPNAQSQVIFIHAHPFSLPGVVMLRVGASATPLGFGLKPRLRQVGVVESALVCTLYCWSWRRR